MQAQGIRLAYHLRNKTCDDYERENKTPQLFHHNVKNSKVLQINLQAYISSKRESIKNKLLLNSETKAISAKNSSPA